MSQPPRRLTIRCSRIATAAFINHTLPAKALIVPVAVLARNRLISIQLGGLCWRGRSQG